MPVALLFQLSDIKVAPALICNRGNSNSPEGNVSIVLCFL